MAVTTAPTPAFPTLADGGYDPSVVDAAFEAERAWRRYLEERAALLLREAQALHSALAMPGVAGPAAPAAPVAERPAPVALAPVGPVEDDELLKARRVAEKRKAAAEKRKATIAAKKAAAQAEAEPAAERPQVPAAVPAQADPTSTLSPGAAWARRAAGVAVPTPDRPVAKPRPAVSALPAPTALSFPALGVVPVPASEAPAPKAKRAAPAKKDAPKPAPSVVSSTTVMFGPVASMGPILEPAGSAGRTESRVIRLV